MEKTTLESFNPTTGKLIKELPITSQQDIKSKVSQAHRAQESWRQLTIDERMNHIKKGYDLIFSNREDMAQLIHDEMGKTPLEAEREIQHYCGNLEPLYQEVKDALSSEIRTDTATKTHIYHDPLGVCASITPWNFPLGMPHTLIIPSLLAGNTVLFKPSEEVTLIGLKYAELLNQALPENVLQVIIGTGQQGQQLVESDVQLITFTGSQATGKKILGTASCDLKRVILELGGKDPLIVAEDADLEAAAQFAATSSFRNAGQVCVSTEKIYVRDTVADDFIEKLKRHTADIQIGHMIHRRQKDHVLQQVKDALSDGAKIIYGELCQDSSNYFSPIILENLTPEMNIMREETFGPVACVVRVKSDSEAVKLANLGNYALGGVIFSKDLDRSQKIARSLNSGMVGLNRSPSGAKGCPWVGAKQSGYGFHGSKEGHRQFTQLRIISHPLKG